MIVAVEVEVEASRLVSSEYLSGWVFEFCPSGITDFTKQ